MSLLRRIGSYVRPYSGRFTMAVLCMAVFSGLSGAGLTLVIPLADAVFQKKDLAALEKFRDEPVRPTAGIVAGARYRAERSLHSLYLFLHGSPWRVLKLSAILIIAAVLLRGAFDYLQGYLMAWVEQRAMADLRVRAFDHIQTLSLDYFEARRTGQIMAYFTSDLSAIQGAIRSFLRDVPLQGMQVLIFLGLCLWLDWRSVGFALAIVGLVLFPIVQIARKLRHVSHAAQESQAEMSGVLQEAISGIRIVQAFTMERFETTKFTAQVRSYFDAIMRSARAAALQSPIVEFGGALAGVAVFLYMGDRVIHDRLSAGMLMAFLLAMAALMKPLKQLSTVYTSVQSAMAAAERMFGMLDMRPAVVDRSGAVATGPVRMGIVLRGVGFAYTAGHPVLRRISLEVRAGQMTAIVGASGAGKSTLISLLPRFHDPIEGAILFDGRDIREFSLSSLRRQIGVVLQETFLFHDTVEQNIRYGNPDAPRHEVEAVARAAHAHEFIEKLPRGYDTIVGERGVKLSGGQRQRLTIARALLRDPSVLILDEATSSLDAESERLVQDALEVLMRGRTTFVVAHRLSTVQRADRIVVLDRGEIVEEGVHAELLARGGVYRRLYETQLTDQPTAV